MLGRDRGLERERTRRGHVVREPLQLETLLDQRTVPERTVGIGQDDLVAVLAQPGRGPCLTEEDEG